MSQRLRSLVEALFSDLRERVIEAVVAGASRREAAESFSLSASSAVRWLQRWRDTGRAREPFKRREAERRFGYPDAA
jgi:transposase